MITVHGSTWTGSSDAAVVAVEYDGDHHRTAVQARYDLEWRPDAR